MIRLGRISYVNMAPVFFRLEHAVEEVTGVPTELNRMLVAGELDWRPSPRSSTPVTPTGCGSFRACACRPKGRWTRSSS